MLMSEEMDAGDILLQRTLSIAPDDTTATLSERLARLGAEALGEALTRLRSGGLDPLPQNPGEVTYAPRLTKEDGRIRWQEAAVMIERVIRAHTPWPGSFTDLGGRRVKILEARVASTASGADPRASSGSPAPGTILALGDAIGVATGSGVLELHVLQMEGKRALPAAPFAAGARLRVGARFDA